MDAKIVNLKILFGDQVSYQIPQFQRPYAWGETDQWMPLWGDVRNVAERRLSAGGGASGPKPHFLGAIVLQRRKSKTGEVTKQLVVDGQQRLTTLQLLVKAAQRAFHHADDFEREERLRALTENSDSHLGGDDNNQTKIRQSNLNDQRAFKDAIRVTFLDEYGNYRPITQAFKYFEGEVKAWLDDGTHSAAAKSDALEDALTERILIAVIDLDEDEAPHLIFETLNARGEPLTQSDLVKNAVMYEANVVDDALAADRLWGLFNAEWWRESTGEARLSRLQIDRFLNHWLIMRTRKRVAPNRVASEFRDFLGNDEYHSPKPADIVKVAYDMRSTGRIYQSMLQVGYPEHETFLKRMRVMDMASVMPLLLYLKSADMPAKRLARCFQIIESYFVRRALYQLMPRHTGDISVSLLRKLHEERTVRYPDITIARHLSASTQDATLWPGDRALRESLNNAPMGGTIPRRRMVLEAIEMDMRGDATEPIDATDRLTLEYIMPHKWEAHYPPPGNKTIDEISDRRNYAVKLLGNLTLTTSKLNASLSNAPWHEKRDTLDRHSSLFLNKTLPIGAYIGGWDEDAIDARTSELAERILNIWKPAEYFLSETD